MNYQILLESYAAGKWINKDEISLLELELDSQLESIKFSRTQGCTEKAPKHICEATKVCEVAVRNVLFQYLIGPNPFFWRRNQTEQKSLMHF